MHDDPDRRDWFDEDHTVVDSTGRIIVQTRQLALVPGQGFAGMARIAIIGGGGMGEALLAGLLRAGRQVKDLVVAERLADRADYLSNKYSVRMASVGAAVETADFVIVAVKPSDAESVVAVIAELAAQADSDTVEQVLISVCAGITTAFYEARLPAGSPVIRVMPNAPALVGAGSAPWPGRFATDEHRRRPRLFRERRRGGDGAGKPALDAVTAVSGSGPAYFYLFVEALVDAAVANGLQRAIATDLVAQTMAGSAAMLLERIDDERTAAGTDTGLDTPPRATARHGDLPAGTTAAGLRELERGAVRGGDRRRGRGKTRSEQPGITSE